MNDSFVNQPGKLSSILSYEVKVVAHVDHEQAFQHLWNKIVMVPLPKLTFLLWKKDDWKFFSFEIVLFQGICLTFLGGLLIERFLLLRCFLPMALFDPASVFAIAAYRKLFQILTVHDSNWRVPRGGWMLLKLHNYNCLTIQYLYWINLLNKYYWWCRNPAITSWGW